ALALRRAEIGDDRARPEDARRLQGEQLRVAGPYSDAVTAAGAHSSSLASAFTAAAAMALPPRRPWTVSHGTPCDWRVSAALDSAAPTNPTGTPMIAAGCG